MLKIIEDKNLCSKIGVDGCYRCGFEEIVVEDRNNKPVLVHEISHYLWENGDTDYLDSILGICALLEIDFWDIVNVQEVSEIVDDYEVLVDELCAYFMEQVYLDSPELVLESHPIYRIILERGVNDE